MLGYYIIVNGASTHFESYSAKIEMLEPYDKERLF